MIKTKQQEWHEVWCDDNKYLIDQKIFLFDKDAFWFLYWDDYVLTHLNYEQK